MERSGNEAVVDIAAGIIGASEPVTLGTSTSFTGVPIASGTSADTVGWAAVKSGAREGGTVTEGTLTAGIAAVSSGAREGDPVNAEIAEYFRLRLKDESCHEEL